MSTISRGVDKPRANDGWRTCLIHKNDVRARLRIVSLADEDEIRRSLWERIVAR